MYVVVKFTGEFSAYVEVLGVADNKLAADLWVDLLKKKDERQERARQEVDAIVKAEPYPFPMPIEPKCGRKTKTYKAYKDALDAYYDKSGDWEYEHRESALKIVAKKYQISETDIPYSDEKISYVIKKLRKQGRVWINHKKTWQIV